MWATLLVAPSSCDGFSHGEAKYVVTCCLFRLERENWKSDIVSKPKLRSNVNLKADYGGTEGYVQRTRVKGTKSAQISAGPPERGNSPIAN